MPNSARLSSRRRSTSLNGSNPWSSAFRGGPATRAALNELGRCFHTLKGAAGSVGLIELASQVHYLEQGLEDAAGQVTPELLDQLHQVLGQMEGVLDSLRQGSGSGPCPERCAGASGRRRPVSLDRPESLREGPRTSIPVAEDEKPVGDDPLSTEPADGPIRIPSSRMDELMDLASELIARAASGRLRPSG